MKKNLIAISFFYFLGSSSGATVNVYSSHSVSGWPVYINSTISGEDDAVSKKYLFKLDKSLSVLKKKMPKYSYDYLKNSGLKIIIVTPKTIGDDFKMLYILENTSNWNRKYEKFLDNSIVIPAGLFSSLNDSNFLYYITHELAHHYHFSLVGYSNEYVWRKYWAAKRDPDYPITYGLESHLELFAELSVNFFIMRADLAKIDKEGMSLMAYIWSKKFFDSRIKLYNSLPTVNMKAIMKRQATRENKIFNNK